MGKSKTEAGTGRLIPLNETAIGALEAHAAWLRDEMKLLDAVYGARFELGQVRSFERQVDRGWFLSASGKSAQCGLSRGNFRETVAAIF